jgi:DNA-binding response OmpR family regulator
LGLLRGRAPHGSKELGIDCHTYARVVASDQKENLHSPEHHGEARMEGLSHPLRCVGYLVLERKTTSNIDQYCQSHCETLDYQHPERLRMAAEKILLVDDDEIIRLTMGKLLEENGFDVTVTGTVSEALKLISSEQYDVLLSDLHMPGAGDGLTVVSAMRHANSQAVTMLLTSFPEMKAAAHAILCQADEILVKPMDISALVATIRKRLSGVPAGPRNIESVATILERSTEECIAAWFEKVQLDVTLSAIKMTREQRCSHLPQVFRDLITRLKSDHPLGAATPPSAGAADHGRNRRRSGYSAAMLVEESRILQVSIFHTLQENLRTIDFSVLLFQVMTIADEVDSQLRQAVECYVIESAEEGLHVTADNP